MREGVRSRWSIYASMRGVDVVDSVEKDEMFLHVSFPIFKFTGVLPPILNSGFGKD
jgi:hypothetical protein